MSTVDQKSSTIPKEEELNGHPTIVTETGDQVNGEHMNGKHMNGTNGNHMNGDSKNEDSDQAKTNVNGLKESDSDNDFCVSVPQQDSPNGKSKPQLSRAFTAKRGHLKSESQSFDWAGMVLLLFEGILIVLFYTMTKYKEKAYKAGADPADMEDNNQYLLFSDIMMMCLVGFGYLMNFSYKYRLQSLSLTFLITVIILQWGLICVGWAEMEDEDSDDHKWEYHTIQLSITSLIGGEFAAVAVLITLGALLGRVNTFQIIFIGIFEVIFYSINLGIFLNLDTYDVGGTYLVHMFGAYFGLGAAWHFTKGGDNPKSDYTSDTFAMIGTFILWIFFPSYNAALSSYKWRAVLNSVLSLSGCATTSILMSRILRHGKVSMVEVQNATLAGGIAVGCIADWDILPATAIVIGAISGILSVCCYKWLVEFIENKLKIRDSCGVHALHGLPAVYGAIVSTIVAAAAEEEWYSDQEFDNLFPAGSTGKQAGRQILFCVITIALALLTGFLTGLVARFLPKVKPEDWHNDYQEVEIEQDHPAYQEM